MDRADREQPGAGRVISPRDEIWIDMMQFDARAADRLWERSAPPDGAPDWYGEVSGLIETASGPAEPHELVDEPIVVEDMHRTTLGRPPVRCRRMRRVGRVIVMKAAVATAASVFGVAAAAATTGIVATMASVVVPAINGGAPEARDEPGSVTPVPPASGATADRPNGEAGNQATTLAEAPPATPMPAMSPRPAAPGKAASTTSPAPSPPVGSDAKAVPPGQVASGPTAIDPTAVTPDPSAAHKPKPAKAPPATTPPAHVVPAHDTRHGPGAAGGGSASDPPRKAEGEAARNPGGDTADQDSVERTPGHSRRSG
jgi:hypothetical protein